jgi:PAC2 family
VLDPEGLYEIAADVDVPPGMVLLEALDGFIDIAGVSKAARDHLLATLPNEVVATFDVDQVVDYRARRPLLTFDRDHWSGYADPLLAIHLVTDPDGNRFLLLSGPEPDVQWERFIAAVRAIVERFEIRLVIGLQAIPMAVPHTRPVGITAHGSRPELISGFEPWVDQVHVPGSAGSLLEYRLGQAGLDAMGFAVHVPQYLAQAEFPQASATLLEAVAAAAELVVPVDALTEAGTRIRGEIDAQVERSEEIAAVVAGLERQYDALVESRLRQNLLDGDENLPSGEELGAELERFLAEQSGHGDNRDG